MENNENNIQESNSLRKLKMLGGSTSENIHLESDKEVKGDFWSNLWYQHKWAIILGSIAVIMLVVLIFMLANDKKEDLNIMYVGPEPVIHKVEEMSEKLSNICDDYDGDGEIVLNFPTLIYQTDAQRQKLKDTHPEKLITPQANSDALGQFQAQLMSGALTIYLLDPELYEQSAKSLCVPISEILGDTSTLKDGIVYDDRAINFSKTTFAIRYDEFDILPSDTVMCVVKTVNTDSDLFENSCDFFKSIVEFN
jgi:hypothetical protein